MHQKHNIFISFKPVNTKNPLTYYDTAQLSVTSRRSKNKKKLRSASRPT